MQKFPTAEIIISLEKYISVKKKKRSLNKNTLLWLFYVLYIYFLYTPNYATWRTEYHNECPSEPNDECPTFQEPIH